MTSNEDAPFDELRVMRWMVNQSRRTSGDYWQVHITFGLLGVVAALSSHALVLAGRWQDLWIPWSLFLILGLGISLVLIGRSARKHRVQTLIDRLMGATWTAIGITVVCLSMLAVAEPEIFGPSIGGIITLVIAAGLFVTGSLLESLPLKLAAFLWWTGGIVCCLRPADSFVIGAGLMIFGYVLPALLLRRSSQGLRAEHSRP